MNTTQDWLTRLARQQGQLSHYDHGLAFFRSPMGPGLANRPINGKPSGQPYTEYDEVEKIYKGFGDTVK